MRQRKGLTVIEHNGETIAQLYKTKIVVINPDTGTITLNSGGWHTNHTKNCMNDVLSQFGVSVKQTKGTWYVHAPKGYKFEYKDGYKLDLRALGVF